MPTPHRDSLILKTRLSCQLANLSTIVVCHQNWARKARGNLKQPLVVDFSVLVKPFASHTVWRVDKVYRLTITLSPPIFVQPRQTIGFGEAYLPSECMNGSDT